MNKLREIRIDRKMSANKLAIMCGTTRQNISNIEHGKNKPSINLAKKLGDALSVDWKVFFDDTD